MYLAQNIKYLREYKGELQKDIADLLGVSISTMSKYESGDCEPDIEKLIMLADLFGITVDDLIRKELKPPIPLYTLNIRYMRKKQGMLQADIGKLIGVGQKEISNYEKGDREIPLTKLMILADFFGVTLDDLVKQDLSKEK
ncbi:MAG: helix-turn-helix transcriptional regulator [Lachnospiraceae bacterium]|jgi:transcriptional regulator with XRE-family HTH domain|nr:helix-turn-helix transcriptional regulator [Lachnospiraceae bacterium]